MAIPKEVKHSEKFIKWFSELDKTSGKIAGGKGANLAEMYNLKISVPPGFVVTAQAYDYFIEKAGIKEKIKEFLSRIDYEDTSQLDEITKNIRKFIVDSKIPKEMENEIIEAYEVLDIGGFDSSKAAIDILNHSSEPVFVAVRSSATTEDLAEASFAGQQETYINIKGNDQLLKSVKKCFASLFTSRATYYRHKKGFKHEDASLAVVVQKMIDANKSGVIFSKDPTFKNNEIIIEAIWGLGEGIVSGMITPDKYVISEDLEIINKIIANKKLAITRDSAGKKAIVKLTESKSNQQVLSNPEIKKLSEIALKLENHYKKPQDIEFALESGEIFIVQTRPITTIESRVSRESLKEVKGEVILSGLAASPGIASGKVKIIEDLKDLSKIQTGDILVTKMTNPDMVVTMQKSSGIITNEGGLTAHAAIVSREMGIPCIVGTQEATTRLKEGEFITLDGYTGKIYKGKVAETEKKEVQLVTSQTKTKIKVIVDLPSFAERASKTGIKKVGLTRIEGIIAESGKHPEYFLNKGKIKDYEEIIFKGVSSIAKYFEELWIRTSDIRSDEFQNLEGAPKEIEANPMLGLHGIRYSLKKPDILKAELNALKRVAEQGKTIGLLLPQLILVEEIKEIKKILKQINFMSAKVGVMIETPAAVQMIREITEEGIDFISFGTNDLTQYILAIDRGNEKVQYLYNEMNPAILYQLEFVIRVCKRAGVETSICGQSGSKKEMVKFLVEKGIDSISVNADMAKEISDYIAELEMEMVKGTDKEPREYQPKKEIKMPMKFNPGKEKYEPDTEKLQKDIKAIEKEKKEYLEENPEEKIDEIPPFNPESEEDGIPEINGAVNTKEEIVE
ncbi:MAG TPA: phosphoenolpyruvate synthase, partial [Candidatus Nanoarchaeia archaeon]|nr:phosphoenolpyruvate synthase [Candidatus Nanoarchaeia archaeon]